MTWPSWGAGRRGDARPHVMGRGRAGAKRPGHRTPTLVPCPSDPVPPGLLLQLGMGTRGWWGERSLMLGVCDGLQLCPCQGSSDALQGPCQHCIFPGLLHLHGSVLAGCPIWGRFWVACEGRRRDCPHSQGAPPQHVALDCTVQAVAFSQGLSGRLFCLPCYEALLGSCRTHRVLPGRVHLLALHLVSELGAGLRLPFFLAFSSPSLMNWSPEKYAQEGLGS